MEIRVLEYFLMVAREENITKAAQQLHLTQPTLSRQLMQLEDELQTTLFIRGKRKIELTEAGRLLRRRAEEIVSMVNKTQQEVMANEEISGQIMIGTGIFDASQHLLPKIIEEFHHSYPEVQFDIYTGNADLIKERLDNGLVDIGILLEPVNIEKYNFIRLTKQERWGIIISKEHPLALQSSVRADDLKQLKGNEFFGGCPIEGDNPPNLRDILELNKRLGMSFNVNYHTAYQSRAPKGWRKENPQWRIIENVADFNRQYGFETLLTNYAPFPVGTKLDAEGGEIVTPEIEQDVYEYHRELASRFRGKIRYFETFAEYLKSPLKQKAAAADRVIRAAFRGIKDGNPDAVFCALGENKMDQGMLLAKMEELFRHGTLESMDFISLHPYELGKSANSHETMRTFA